MADKNISRIFQKGSRTYYYSSIFFPDKIRENVFRLYAFVRTADDFVDAVPQKKGEFMKFREDTELALKGGSVFDLVINEFVKLVKEKNIKKEWVISFLEAMEADLGKSKYRTFSKLEKYMYGSAEVVGLMMARIMDLSEESYIYAKLLGKSMQYINFIRDIMEDNYLKRNYLPISEVKSFGLLSLTHNEAGSKTEAFTKFIRHQIKRYESILSEAEKGFGFIPKRYLIPIKTASDMYRWTAREIYNNPMIVFEKKVKPSVLRIILGGIYNIISI